MPEEKPYDYTIGFNEGFHEGFTRGYALCERLCWERFEKKLNEMSVYVQPLTKEVSK
jgi:hypothetical protein